MLEQLLSRWSRGCVLWSQKTPKAQSVQSEHSRPLAWPWSEPRALPCCSGSHLGSGGMHGPPRRADPLPAPSHMPGHPSTRCGCRNSSRPLATCVPLPAPLPRAGTGPAPSRGSGKHGICNVQHDERRER